MKRMTSPSRLTWLCAAVLLAGCEPTSASEPERTRREDAAGPVAQRPRQVLASRAEEELDGCEMVMHPCQWEEACTAPCGGATGHCCQGHWVCPGGSAQARQVTPSGSRSRVTPRGVQVTRKPRPRTVLTFTFDARG